MTPELLAQLDATLWLPRDMTDEEKAAHRAAARAMLDDIDPAGGIDSKLAVQMVASHDAALDCLRRPAIPDRPAARRDRELKHAKRLLALYVLQGCLKSGHSSLLGSARMDNLLKDHSESPIGQNARITRFSRAAFATFTSCST